MISSGWTSILCIMIAPALAFATDFGDQPVNSSSAEKTIVLIRRGTTIAGFFSYPSDFPEGPSTTCFPGYQSVDCQITAVFRPTKAGPISESITVEYSGISNNISVSYALSGNGTPSSLPGPPPPSSSPSDGKADLILQYDTPDGVRHWQARLSNGSGNFVWNGDWATTSTPGVNLVGVADVNNDSRADLILQYDTPDGVRHWQARRSNGSGSFVWNGDWAVTSTPGVNFVGLADVNNDGKADLILQYDTQDGVRHWQARLSDGSGNFVWNGDWTVTSTPGVNFVGLADVNNDGKADLILQYDTPDGVRHWQARLSDGSGNFVWNGDWAVTSTPGVNFVGVADVNHDGKADLILQYDTQDGVRHWQARLSDGGGGFVWNGDWAVTSTPGVNFVGLADVNNDGKADLILQYDTPDGVRHWQARLSDGSGNFVWNGDWAVTSTPGVNFVGLADVNNDGKADLILQYDTPDGIRHWQARLSDGGGRFVWNGDWAATSTPGVNLVGLADAAKLI